MYDEKLDMSGEGVKKTAEEMVEYYDMLISKYPVISIEDRLAEDDGMAEMADHRQSTACRR